MGTVLETFFRISMILTLIIIGMNVFISTFGHAMTGQNLSITTEHLNPERFVVINDENTFDVNYTVNVYGTSIIEQTTNVFVRPIVQIVDWAGTLGMFGDLAFGSQKVLLFIFVSIGAPEAGAALIVIITAIQMIGAAYIPFAILSAFTGGGSP